MTMRELNVSYNELVMLAMDLVAVLIAVGVIYLENQPRGEEE